MNCNWANNKNWTVIRVGMCNVNLISVVSKIIHSVMG